MTNIVKTTSEGNKYKYASLSDIANQGYIIPKMKVETEPSTLKDYVCYQDGEQWIRGAEIVVPSPILNKEGKATMNEAQLYGSALTYARRYTTLMSLGLACEDDKELESKPAPTQKQCDYLRKLIRKEELETILDAYQVANVEDLPMDVVSDLISQCKKKIEERRCQNQ